MVQDFGAEKYFRLDKLIFFLFFLKQGKHALFISNVLIGKQLQHGLCEVKTDSPFGHLSFQVNAGNSLLGA